MRVLVISFFFPPYNVIGAVRVGKTAKYLRRSGEDVRVLAAANLDFIPNLELEIPAGDVVYTDWVDFDRPYRALVSGRNWIRRRLPGGTAARAGSDRIREQRPSTFNSEGPQSEARTLAWRFRLLYTDLVHFPDSARGWRRSAVRAGRELARDWPPHVILASGAPWTSFVVARDLSNELGVPWVADLRDLWSANHTTFVSNWRKRTLDVWHERRVLRSASALVTVSEPLAKHLRECYPDKQVEVIMNGFDPEDYKELAQQGRNGLPTEADPSASRSPLASDSPILRLLYTGEINRDMRPLLGAMKLLGTDARSVHLEIVGAQSATIRERYRAVAAAYGIEDRVSWLPPVSHAEACRLQQQADVLVLLMHNSPDDAGVYTGKLFEYVGARRPILVAGADSGVAAELVRDRQLGFAEASADRIADRLRAWLGEKRTVGKVAPAASSFIGDLSREAQARAFADVLRRPVRT
jgi:glycosyltransferase involved in cell wall biosynthesis